MEDCPDEFETFIRVAQSVAMSQEEYLTVDLCGQRLLMQYDATLLLQIIVSPYIVVACEVMHLNTHVCELGNLSEESGKPLWHYIFVFVPEVKHVAEQVYGRCLLLDRVKEAHEPSLLHPLVGDCKRTQMGIG